MKTVKNGATDEEKRLTPLALARFFDNRDPREWVSVS